MNDEKLCSTFADDAAGRIDVGRPVEWMLDPMNPAEVLGVTYLFSETSARHTVWYTTNKRRPKGYVTVSTAPEAPSG